MNNRRDILKMMSGYGGARMLAGSGATSILHMMVQGYFSKLYAQSQRVQPRKFIDMNVLGGFASHYCYLPLKPRTSDSFAANGWVATRWNSGGAVYETLPVTSGSTTIQMPPVWGVGIPKATARGAGLTDSSAVFQKSIFMRGLWNAFDSHGFGWLHKSRPSPSALSIGGVVADAADPIASPLTAIGINPFDTSGYAAKKIAQKIINTGGDRISAIVNPVIADTNMRNLLSTRDGFSQQFNAALEAVASDVRGIREGADNILASVASAESLLRRNFGNLTDRWNSLLAKYRQIMRDSRDITGVIPNAINPAAGSLLRRVEGDDTNFQYATAPDLRQIFTPTSEVQWMAENFATLEFLMEENLSHMVSCDIISVVGLNVVNEMINGGIVTAGPLVTSHGLDQHVSGSGFALAVNTFYSRALIACMNEFVLRMTELGKMDDLLIRVSSEFTRAPRNTGTGSDHGWQANCFWLVSGGIHQPQVVGNIIRNSPDVNRSGTWGYGGLVNHEGSPIRINMGHAVSSVAAALRVTSPVDNFLPILRDDTTSGIISTVGEGTTGET